MAAVIQPISIFTSPSYQQVYSDPFLNDIGYAVTRSISAFRDSTNTPQPLVIGATSNLSLETANNMNLYAGMSNSFLYYQTWMNGSTRVDRQVLNVNANLTQTIFNYPQDVIIQSTSSNNPQATLQDVTFSRNNSNTLVDTTQSNFYFTKNITAAQNVQVGQNMFVNGSLFSCNLNVWLDKVNTPYSRIGYGFRINSNDQLELIKYAKYGSGDVLKKVAIFGTNPIGSNDRSDSSNYLVFNSLGQFGVGNSSNNSFTPLNSYGNAVNPLSNLFTQALTMSNVTSMDSSAIRFFQPSIFAQGIVYTSNDVNVGGSLNVANNFSIGGSFSVASSLSTNSNLYVAGNAAFGIALSNALAPVHIENVDVNSNSLYTTGGISACNLTLRNGGVLNITGNVTQRRGIKFDNSTFPNLNRAIQLFGDDSTHNNYYGMGVSSATLQLCTNTDIAFFSTNTEVMRMSLSALTLRGTLNTTSNINVSSNIFCGNTISCSNATCSNITVSSNVNVFGNIIPDRQIVYPNATGRRLVLWQFAPNTGYSGLGYESFTFRFSLVDATQSFAWGAGNNANGNIADLARLHGTTGNLDVLGNITSSNTISCRNATCSNITVNNSLTTSNVAASNINVNSMISGATSTSGLTVSGTTTLNGVTTINNDMVINGSLITVNTSNMVVSDNLISLNNGLTTSPSLMPTSGFEIRRGTASNSYFILYDESAQLLRAGFSNSAASSLNPVCTRADGLATGYPYYDASSRNLINRGLSNADITDAPLSYSTSNVLFNNAGSVGIGTNVPTYKLHVAGDVFAADFKASSDRRLKKDFEVIGGALDKIRQISGYTFSRVEGAGDKRFAGVVAQEMQAVLPEVVDTDTNGFLNVSYGNIAALLIQGIKELDDKLTKLIGV